MVLRARVAVQLRAPGAGLSWRVQVGPYVFDFQKMDFSCNGKNIELSRTEQRLLRVLLGNRGATDSSAGRMGNTRQTALWRRKRDSQYFLLFGILEEG